MEEDNSNDLDMMDKMIEDENVKAPKDGVGFLKMTQAIRMGLVRKHIKDTDDPAMLARIDSLLGGIDRQEMTKMKMAQDKEEGQANREIGLEIFKQMVKHGTTPTEANPGRVDVEESGIDILDDELIQGDDTLRSVID